MSRTAPAIANSMFAVAIICLATSSGARRETTSAQTGSMPPEIVGFTSRFPSAAFEERAVEYPTFRLLDSAVSGACQDLHCHQSPLGLRDWSSCYPYRDGSDTSVTVALQSQSRESSIIFTLRVARLDSTDAIGETTVRVVRQRHSYLARPPKHIRDQIGALLDTVVDESGAAHLRKQGWSATGPITSVSLNSTLNTARSLPIPHGARLASDLTALRFFSLHLLSWVDAYLGRPNDGHDVDQARTWALADSICGCALHPTE